ncbi:hypothetical protein QBC46DRAFT_462889 [Diplogelasinospora grovesii]|uniref:Rhodopsin domain-containing protein n=1 Tax=Diplogelasinospora grovesii TaxID=303347 RepID=A0AAN6RYV6_9PEZI|nr:hypothetical protein QBC46DRAFT_462889 [Diplogelasinospora grovesii]
MATTPSDAYAAAAVDGQTKRPAIIAISVVFPAVAALVVALRLYTRLCILKLSGLDDWVILVALVLAIGASTEIMLESYWGLGLHVWVVTPDMMAQQLKALYTSIINYNIANNLLLVFVMVWAVMQSVLLSLSCIPAALTFPGMADKCLDTLPVWYFSSSMNIVTDFVIFALPLPCVLSMTLCKPQKVLFISLFCLGFSTCIVSIIRIFTLRRATTTGDPSWDNTESTLWSVIELNCGILCASLQTLRPLLAKMVPSLVVTAGTFNSVLFDNRSNNTYNFDNTE